MIDVHCHILPGVDDGPRDLAESVEMCRVAASDGVRRIVATPHCNPYVYVSAAAGFAELAAELNSAIKKEGIPLTVQAGSEVHATPDLAARLKKSEALALDARGRYVLVEFPFETMPPNWERFLLSLREGGYTPVMAHPERNAWFLKRPEAASDAVSKGLMLVQITAMSVTGELGQAIRDFSAYLLEMNLVHVVASDAHSASYRPPVLSEARRAAAAIIGAERAAPLFTTNAEAIADGRALAPLQPVEPRPIAQKRWLQRLLP